MVTKHKGWREPWSPWNVSKHSLAAVDFGRQRETGERKMPLPAGHGSSGSWAPNSGPWGGSRVTPITTTESDAEHMRPTSLKEKEMMKPWQERAHKACQSCENIFPSQRTYSLLSRPVAPGGESRTPRCSSCEGRRQEAFLYSLKKLPLSDVARKLRKCYFWIWLQGQVISRQSHSAGEDRPSGRRLH